MVEKKELYVPRIILKYETNEIVTCHQNDTNFTMLKTLLDNILSNIPIENPIQRNNDEINTIQVFTDENIDLIDPVFCFLKTKYESTKNEKIKFNYKRTDNFDENLTLKPCFYVFMSTTFRLDGYNKKKN